MGSRHWQLFIALFLVSVAALGVGYYVYHFLGEREFLIDQNRRILAEVSTQVSGEIDGVAPMMRNAARELYRGNFFLKGKPYPYSSRDREIRVKRVEDFIEQLAGFELIALEKLESVPKRSADPVDAIDALRPTLSTEAGRLRVRLSPLPYCCACAPPGRADCDVALVVEADPERLFASIRRESPFHDVLLADESGAVIVQRESRGAQTTHLDGLLTSASEPPLASRSSRVVASAPHRVRAEVGGEEHWVLLQPTPVEALDVGGESGGASQKVAPTVWTVAALMPAGQFLDETLDIPTSLVLLPIIVILVLIGLGSLWLRLWNCGPYETFSRGELALAGFAFAGLVGVLGIVVLDWGAIRHRARTLDADLEQLAGDLDRSFGSELSMAFAELNSGAELLAEALNAQEEKNQRDYKGIEAAFVQEPRVLQSREGAFTRYPYFDQLVWLDPLGAQRVKWAAYGVPTPAGSYADRPYFKEPRRGRLWRSEALGRCKDATHHELRGLFIQPITSRTTGERLAVIAAPADDQGELLDCADLDPAEPRARQQLEPAKLRPRSQSYAGYIQDLRRESPSPNVVTLVTWLHSLDRPVVPPGLDFVVLDEKEGILFYSRSDTRLLEMVQESLKTDDVRKLLDDGEAGRPESIRYHGLRLHLYVKPFSLGPWTVITVGTSDGREATNTSALIEVAAKFSYYAALVVFVPILGFGLASLRWEIRGDGWLWPDAQRVPAYLELAVALASLSTTAILASIDVIRAGDYLSDLLVLFGLGLLSTVVAVLGVQGSEVGRRRTRMLVALIVAAALAFAVASVASASGSPTAAVWSVGIAVLASLGLFLVSHRERALVEAAERSYPVLRSTFALFGVSLAVALGATPASILLERTLTDRLEDSLEEERRAFGESVLAWVDRGNGSSERRDRIREVCPKEGSEPDWPVYLRAELGKRCVAGAPPALEPRVDAPDELARVAAGSDLRPPVLAGLLVLGLAVAMVSRRCLGASYGWTLDVSDRLALSSGGRWLHVGPSKDIDASAIDDASTSQVAIFDMRSARERAEADSATKDYILLRYFESMLGSDTLRGSAYELLQRLSDAGKKVHIACEVEPLRWLSDPIRRNEENVQKDLARWANLLSRFRVRHRAVERAAPEPDESRLSIKIGRECGVSPRLATLAQHLRLKAKKEQLVEDMVLRRARGEFIRLWELCTDRERSVLYLLANGNIVSYPNRQVAAELLRRGLVVWDGGFWIESGAFRRFVIATVTPDDEARWLQLGGGPGWALWRNAFLVVMALGAGFVAVTQRDAFIALGGFLGVLAGLPLVARLMSGFSTRGADK